MLLKALEIQGFKSFPDKTVLTFGEGITAVVGPNGSGKSNISDAIRWVLGEQSTKSLRGTRMEDVIFNGTATRKGVGFAEVSLIVDNRDRILDFDSDDVKVTRRYYRSGESEYLINNATVRLKDVQLMFMDTGLGRDGYSIIGQGRIGDIVSSRPEDRREIFEEAAGIAKYRYRKNEAERRLKATQENLLRLQDILAELEERVGPLKIQAEKAKQFLEYAGQKKQLEIGLWLHTLNQSRDVLRDLNAKLELARTQYDQAGLDMDALEQEIQEIAEQGQRLAAEMDDIRRNAAKLEEEAVRCEGEVAVFQNDIYHNKENIARIQQEIAASHAGGQTIDAEIAAREQAIRDKQAGIADCQQQMAALSEQIEELSRSSDAVQGQMDELSRQASDIALALSDVRVRQVTGESSLSEITLRLSQLTEAIATRNAQSESVEAELSRCQQDYRQVSERVEQLQNTLKGYELRYQSRVTKRNAARETADKLALDAEEARRRVRLLEDLEKNMEGFSGSVKAIVKQAQRGMLRGIHGPVSQLLQTRPEYALAIETALGAAAQNIVCDTEEDAKRAINFLKDNNIGRATFLPISAIKGSVLSDDLSREPGFVGLACHLVSYDAPYEQIVFNLLGRTVVAEDLDAAVAMGKKYQYRFRVVTLDGQVVHAGGSMTGGAGVKSAGVMSRRLEIERLQQKAADLLKQAEQAKADYHRAEQEASAAEAAMVGVQGELSTAQEDLIRLEGEIRRLTDLVESNRRAVAEFTEEIHNLNQRAEQCKAAIAAAKEEWESLTARKTELEQALKQTGSGRQQLVQQREQLAAQIGELKLAILGYQKEIEADTAAIADLQNRKTDAAGYRAALEQQIAALEQQNAELLLKIEERTQRAAALRAEAAASDGYIQERMARRLEGEKRQTELRQQVREKSEQRELAGREVARLEERCQAIQREADELIAKLYEEYELTRQEAEDLGIVIEDPARAARKLTELKNKIRGLGSVNVDAIEEYKEVSERYEFLSQQVKDVEVSKNELLKLIADLTSQMQEMFLERFQQINYHFGQVFSELFGGGKAELTLEDPGDVLNCGVDMYVQPPGKKIHNLEALSGGEKALVGISLLFAILKVTPSPFCVLDELEAALDDVNVDRYAQYLRRMSHATQFIVITHRRGTMEEADVLYGVTMQEEGISKLLELRASEVEEKLGIQLQQHV